MSFRPAVLLPGLAGQGWQAWRPFPLRLAEYGLTGLGDRAGDTAAICRPDEQIHLEADGCSAQRVHHGRPIGRRGAPVASVRRRAISPVSDKSLQTAAHARERRSSPRLGSTTSCRMEALMHGMPVSSRPSSPDEECITGTSGTWILARRLSNLRSASTGNTFLSTVETSS